jgi:hypothetical protein
MMFDDFNKKLQKLTYMDFDGHDRFDCINMDLSEEELLAEIAKIRSDDLYLGKYTLDEIKDIFTRYKIFEELEKLGYPDVQIEIRTKDVYNHRLYVFTEKRDYDHILIEMRLREGNFIPKQQFLPDFELGPMSMILVDWLMLQNPRKSFNENRPALPQQKYPGLGVLQNLIPLVMEVVKESGRKGVLDVPEHYHGALFYSRWFRFFNPETEGKFLAMQRDLGGHPLHIVSDAIFKDSLINTETGKQEGWVPGEQILPLRSELREYFSHRQYVEKRDEAFLNNRYELDLERYEEVLKG